MSDEARSVKNALAFGEIAVRKGLITQEQLEQALELQQKVEDAGLRTELGEILVKKKILSPQQVSAILAMQGKGVSEHTIPGVKILEKIGQGGMGAVYRARQLSLDREVAVKTLLPMYSTKDDVRERFLREIKAIAKLQHPNIVTGYDAGVSNGVYYYVMEFVRGKDMRKQINRQGRIPAAEAVRIVLEVARAMVHYHDAGFLHRDIKPSNILVDDHRHVKLLDLGLARHEVSTDPALTAVGFVAGTPHYVSPEQARAGDVDIRSDIYNLGASFYEMLTGEAPFEGDTHAVTMAMRLKNDPLFPDQKPAVPKAAKEVVLRMMARNRDDRYGDPTHLVQALEGLQSLLAGDFEEIPDTRKSPARPLKAERIEAAREKRAKAEQRLAEYKAARQFNPMPALGVAAAVLLALLLYAVLGDSGTPDPGPISGPPVKRPDKDPRIVERTNPDDLKHVPVVVDPAPLSEVDAMAEGEDAKPDAVLRRYRELKPMYVGTAYASALDDRIKTWEANLEKAEEEAFAALRFDVHKLKEDFQYVKAVARIGEAASLIQGRSWQERLTSYLKEVQREGEDLLDKLERDLEAVLKERDWEKAEAMLGHIEQMDLPEAQLSFERLRAELEAEKQREMEELARAREERKRRVVGSFESKAEIAVETDSFDVALALMAEILENEPVERSDLEPYATWIVVLGGVNERARKTAVSPPDDHWFELPIPGGGSVRGQIAGMVGDEIIYMPLGGAQTRIPWGNLRPTALWELYLLNPHDVPGAGDLVGAAAYLKEGRTRKAQSHFETAAAAGFPTDGLMELLTAD